MGEGEPRSGGSGAFVHRLLETLFPALFHTACALSAPSGHLPLEGKATKEMRIPSFKKAARHPCEAILSPSTVIPSATEGSLWHCRHMHTCALSQTTPWGFLFRISLTHGLPPCKKDPSTSTLMTNRIRITSHPFSYRCVELCLSEALYPAPSARAVWPHRKAP